MQRPSRGSGARVAQLHRGGRHHAAGEGNARAARPTGRSRWRVARRPPQSRSLTLRDAVGPAGPWALSRRARRPPPARRCRPSGHGRRPAVQAVESLAAARARAGRRDRACRPSSAPASSAGRPAWRSRAPASPSRSARRRLAVAVGPPIAGLTVPARSATSAMPRKIVSGRLRRPVAIRAKSASELEQFQRSWGVAQCARTCRGSGSERAQDRGSHAYTCPVRPT